jgi:dihydroxyacetone kinase-like protein
VGGAAGVIFGTWLRGGAKELAGETVFDARALERFLSGGLVAVQQRGKANLGDKTMLDALAPAAEAAQSMANAGLAAALAEAVSAAGQGVEHTRTLVAMTGKAKALGQRSLGYADPGAISTHLILKFMYEFVAGR